MYQHMIEISKEEEVAAMELWRAYEYPAGLTTLVDRAVTDVANATEVLTGSRTAQNLLSTRVIVGAVIKGLVERGFINPDPAISELTYLIDNPTD